MVSVNVPRSWKEKQRQERQELILQVAEEVLAEKGYHETSMEEIAVRVGVAKGTVYLHFPSKEDMVIALFDRDMQQILQAVEAPTTSGLTASAKLEVLLQFIYGGFFNKRAQLLYSIFNNTELRRLFVEKKGCMHDLWEQLSARITSLLEEGKASGEFDATIPTAVMLRAFIGLLSPKSYDRLILEEAISSDELIKHLSRIYFKGIAAM